ncbi:MAG TPA: hypothetical protein VE871_06490, partial [Longimicrobium sp.]|nr:hypothetical protein [Longimicrobium sp.]
VDCFRMPIHRFHESTLPRFTRLLLLTLLLVPGALAAQQTPPSGRAPGADAADATAALSRVASMLMLDSVAARARHSGKPRRVDVSGLSPDITARDMAVRGLERERAAEGPCPQRSGTSFRDVRRSADGSYTLALHEMGDDGWIGESLWWIACDADGCRVTRVVQTLADLVLICTGADG